MKYCKFCCNATVEPELDSDNDLSYMGVGKTAENCSMHIRSGNGQSTVLLISQYDKELQENINIGVYRMKYCPECGRRLNENENQT